MITFSYDGLSREVVRKAPGPEEVLEALGDYLSNPQNLGKLIRLYKMVRSAVLNPYLRDLGAAYKRLYRQPSTRNYRRLKKVESEAPYLFKPMRFYTDMRDRLLQNFANLENDLVFSNRQLRLQLRVLRANALTLFFMPHLVRQIGDENDEALVDSVNQLSALRAFDIGASLHFLSLTFDAEKRCYDPRLLRNSSYLGFHRLEVVKDTQGNPRVGKQEVARLMNRVRRLSRARRRRMAGRLNRDWRNHCYSDPAFDLWCEMVAGTRSFDTHRLYREMA